MPRRNNRTSQGGGSKIKVDDVDRTNRSGTLASFTCPQCFKTSFNPNDVREGYCGYCHDWTGRKKRS